MQWSPTSWQRCENAQPIVFSDQQKLNTVLDSMMSQPGLVSVEQIKRLKKAFLQVAKGEAFIIQGGDCAERFVDCNQEIILKKVGLLNEVSELINALLDKPIVPIGRFAGQFAKPRSNLFESRNDTVLPSYRGDLLNDLAFSSSKRQLDPQRMLMAYQSVQTILTIIQEVKVSPYISHEALHLYYEQALTRKVDDKWYNLSTHFPWVGMRTCQLEGAQIEYLRGIENPVAIKVGPNLQADELIELIEKLNPINDSGKIVLIHRLGVDKINEVLPELIKVIYQHEKQVIWMCDPMHGNTRMQKTGRKVRFVEDILSELTKALQIHQLHNCYLGGIHLEMTAEAVEECIDTQSHATLDNDNKILQGLIDPRLNSTQVKSLLSAALQDSVTSPC